MPLDLVPADAVFVANLDLADDRRDELEALLRGTTLKGVDNTIARFVEYMGLDTALRCDFESDLQPLLTGSVTAFATPANANPLANVALVVDVEQPQRALAAFARCSDAGPQDRTYSDHSYRSIGDLAFGEVDGHVALGTEDAFTDVIDVVQGDASITDNDTFTEARANHPGEPTALIYIDTQALPGLIGPTVDQLEGPLTLAAHAQDEILAVEASFRPSPSSPLERVFASAVSPGLLHDLPVTTFLGFSLGDLSHALPDVLSLLNELGASPTTRRAFERDFHETLGLELDEVLEWAGPAAIGVSSEYSVSRVSTSFLVESKDSVAMERSVRTSKKWLQEHAPAVENIVLAHVQAFLVYTLGGEIFDVRASGNLLAITLLGPGNVGQSAIGGGDLDQTDEFQAAQEALEGLPVSFFFDATQYRSLYVNSGPSPTGFGNEDFLGAISYAAAGGRFEDGDLLIRLVAGFRQADD